MNVSALHTERSEPAAATSAGPTMSTGAPSAARPDPMFHAVLLAVTVCVIGLAATLQIRGGQQVVLPLVQVPLPAVCTYQRLWGMDCPGCGLTRCFISAAHGDFASAWHYHPVGVFLFGWVCCQIPYRLVQLSRGLRGKREWQPRGWGYWPTWALLLGLLAQWAGRTVWNFL